MKSKSKIRRVLRWTMRLIIWTIVLGILACVGVLALSEGMKHSSKDSIYTIDTAEGLTGDCILVLGCGIRYDGLPGGRLKARLDVGIEAYFMGVSNRLLMSGDHGRVNYDEVNAMKDYAISKGVPSEDVFMDHAGFSTYESMYRAKAIFQCEKIIVVTQEYHLYRAIYNARKMGMEAEGISAALVPDLRSQNFYELREIAARAKDTLYCFVKPHPTYLGETISIFGDGDVTNDTV